MPIADLKVMAIGLRGRSDLINDLTKDKEIYYKENLGKDSLYIVTNNKFDEITLQNAKVQGIEIVPVSTDDICVYLTAKAKGGIDDVFNRN